MKEGGFDGDPLIGIRRRSAFGFDMTLTFDLLTSNVISSSLSPTAPKLRVHLVEFPHVRFVRNLLTNFQYMFTHGRTNEQPEISMPPAAIA